MTRARKTREKVVSIGNKFEQHKKEVVAQLCASVRASSATIARLEAQLEEERETLAATQAEIFKIDRNLTGWRP